MKLQRDYCILLICGSILFGLGFVANALYNSSNNYSLFPTIIGAIFLLLGTVLAIISFFKKTK